MVPPRLEVCKIEKYAHAGSRTWVISMGGLYDAATLHAPCHAGPRVQMSRDSNVVARGRCQCCTHYPHLEKKGRTMKFAILMNHHDDKNGKSSGNVKEKNQSTTIETIVVHIVRRTLKLTLERRVRPA